MKIIDFINKYFNSIVMWVIALHTVIVGLMLCFLPMDMITLFGYKSGEQFFTRQGGAFHIAVSVAYIMAARDPQGNRTLLVFSAAVKFVAVIFLFTYYLLVESLMIVLFSGVVDLAMGIFILIILYRIGRTS